VVRGWLGVGVRNFIPPPPNPYHIVALYGALVDSVRPEGPAAQAGVLPGDVIIRFANRPIATAGALNRAIASTPPGSPIDLRIIRNGQEHRLTAEVGRLADRLLVLTGPVPTSSSLGMAVGNSTTPAGRGVVVTTVTKGSLAAQAGLRRDDLIVSAQGRPVANVDQYLAALRPRGPLTQSMRLGVLSRGGAEREVYLAPAAG
jgi:serine protease Do